MTRIASRKTKIRVETSSVLRKRPLIVELTPHTAVLREKGKRMRYEITWEQIFVTAARILADRTARERKEKRHTHQVL